MSASPSASSIWAWREVARVGEVRACEIGAAESGAGEIGALEQRLAEVRPAQIRAVEPRVAEIGLGQIGHFEIGAGQSGEAQRGVSQPGEGEIDRSAADRPHLPFSDAQRDAGEVRSERRILRAPLVPRPRAATQRLDMFEVRGQRHARNEKQTQLTRTLLKHGTQTTDRRHNEAISLRTSPSDRQAPAG